MSENYAGMKFLDQQTIPGAVLNGKNVGWMIVETANVNTEDGIEKH